MSIENGFSLLSSILRNPLLPQKRKRKYIHLYFNQNTIDEEDIRDYWQMYFDDKFTQCPRTWRGILDAMLDIYTFNINTRPTTLLATTARTILRDENLVTQVIHDMHGNSDIHIRFLIEWSQYMQGYIPIKLQHALAESIQMRARLDFQRSQCNAKKAHEKACEARAELFYEEG